MVEQSVKPTLAQPKMVVPQATAVVRKTASESVDQTATSFRPVLRPPMATIELLDDGRDSGEIFRLRTDRTILGRTGADISIPHDSQVSGTHVAIQRRQADGEWQWILEDLQSTNGTFLRVSRCSMAGTNTVLLGAHRYKFRPAGTLDTAQADDAPAGTRGWKVPTTEELQGATASLVRLFPDGSEQPLPVPASDVKIGSAGSECQVVVSDDPMVDPVHAILKTAGAKTTLEDSKSTNGIWVSVRERRLAKMSTFQIGEQRVRFRIL